MFPKNNREGSQEELEIQLRQRALKSLLLMRQKRLRETLEHRIKRALSRARRLRASQGSKRK